MIVIVLISILLYAIATLCLYNNLYAYENTDKVKFIFICYVLVYALTAIIVMLSATNINVDVSGADFDKAQKIARLIFAPLNSLVIGGFSANIMSKMQNSKKDQSNFNTKIILFGLIIIIGLFGEFKYIVNFIETMV